MTTLELMTTINFSDKASFIWGVADLIRDYIKRSKYQDVILPFTVLRRIDSVLAPTKGEVLAQHEKFKGKLENLDPILRRASGYAFYNTSQFTLERLADDPPNIESNLRNYLNGFSDNMREVLERFDFYNTITKLADENLLFLVVERFNSIDLHPDKVSNLEMGYIFEDLLRRFNEATNENPGEHFTPREVIRLMVNLLIAGDTTDLSQAGIVRKVYDPCCGTGGMLTITKDYLEENNPQAEVYLYGQEVNGETFAIAKSDLFMKSADGTDAERVQHGSTLSDPKHRGETFDYILANPPYGKDWKQDKTAVEKEAGRGHAGRFGAGTPRISDGQLLFLQHMISHMNKDAPSRIAIVLNGSPLFTGDAGSGESEIRRWILENDWLEAIIALPEQLFYNTGIATYVWILSNRKRAERKGNVQLIDAGEIWVPMRKSLGDKRREISPEGIDQITALYTEMTENEISKFFDTTDFGYRKIQVERPLRLNIHVTEDRLERLYEERTFAKLAQSKKKDDAKRQAEIEAGQAEQQAIIAVLRELPTEPYQNLNAFLDDLDRVAKAHDIKILKSMQTAIINALGEQDPAADIVTDSKGRPEADSNLRDTENVPLGENIHAYFEREVLPYVPDAYINDDYTDELDGKIGRVGYEINFNRYFYTYQPPRPLHEIEADIKKLETEIIEMLRDITQ